MCGCVSVCMCVFLCLCVCLRVSLYRTFSRLSMPFLSLHVCLSVLPRLFACLHACLIANRRRPTCQPPSTNIAHIRRAHAGPQGLVRNGFLTAPGPQGLVRSGFLTTPWPPGPCQEWLPRHLQVCLDTKSVLSWLFGKSSRADVEVIVGGVLKKSKKTNSHFQMNKQSLPMQGFSFRGRVSVVTNLSARVTHVLEILHVGP